MRISIGVEDPDDLIADFENGATGVLESSKLASGRNESWRSLDYVEINGSERSFVFTTGDWNKLHCYGKERRLICGGALSWP